MVEEIEEDNIAMDVNIHSLIIHYSKIKREELVEYLFTRLQADGSAGVISFINMLLDDDLRVKMLDQLDFYKLSGRSRKAVQDVIESIYTIDVSVYRSKLFQ